MRFTGFVTVCFSALILASLMGCASFGGGQIAGINWALAKNGGKAIVQRGRMGEAIGLYGERHQV